MEEREDDRHLVQAARNGDAVALERFFRRHHAALFAYLSRWLGDHHLAEDLVQDTFLRVIQSAAPLPDREQLLPWLIRVSRNLAIDRTRREKRFAHIDEAAPAEDPGPLPLERLGVEERDRQLGIALDALPMAHREVLLLRAVHGLDHASIGDLVGCTPAAARARLHRATVALRVAWFAGNGAR